MKLIVVIAQQKDGRTQYIEQEVSYFTALRMVVVDIFYRIKQNIVG